MLDASETPPPAPVAAGRRRKRRVWPIPVGLLAFGLVALILLWDWNWFRPIVERVASAQLGRTVTIGHLSLHVGRHPRLVLDDVEVASPAGFAEAPYFAHVGRLAVTADAMAYIDHRQIVIPRIDVDRPDVNAVQHDDGHATWDFPKLAANSAPSSGPSPQLGDLVITDGKAHVVMSKPRADFGLGIHTVAAADGQPAKIVVDADGTYAKQKITGHAEGGALLTLRDAAHPYPIDARVENGPTKVTLQGTVQDPLHFAGTDLKLHLSGPDMALLEPLSGIPIPQTPPYDIAGQLAYADRKVRFDHFQGRLGSSDIGGDIAVDPTTPNRPTVDADLVSRRVDLADLGGFIGSQPGRPSTPDQSAAQKQAVARANASPHFLPTVPINVPKLNAADVHLKYKGDHVLGRGVPFDSVAATLDIVDGAVRVHPMTLGVGKGEIASTIDLTPVAPPDFHTKADVQFDRVDIGRMLETTGLVKGAGLMGGRIDLDATGNSVSTLVGHGDGNVRLLMAGGNLSALIVDLSGLQVGNAILSAIGIPNRARLQCFALDMGLRRGVLNTHTLLVSTTEGDVIGSGDVDLGRELLDMQVKTLTRHFSVGSLPTPIHIGGTFKSPSIAPEAGPLAARAGAAVALGVLLTPLGALLPTVQFGTGQEYLNQCEQVVRANGKSPTAASTSTPPPPVGATARRGAAAKLPRR